MTQVNIPVKFYYYNDVLAETIQLRDIDPISISYGLADNKPETRMADIGTCTLQLNNESGYYSPGVTPGWKRGALFFAFRIEDDLTEYSIFTGYIDKIQLERNPGDMIVKITAVDWLDVASKFPIVNPNLLQNVTADEVITELLASGIATPITGVNLDVGNVIFPTALDTVRGYTKAYGEFAKLANSELGYIYQRHNAIAGNNEFVFENNTRRNALRQPLEIDYPIGGLGRALFNPENISSIDVVYGENIINHFTSNAYPKRTDTISKKIFQTERDIYLAANETREFRIFWKDETGKRPINAIPPTGNGHAVSLIHFDNQNGDLQFKDELGLTWTCSEGGTWIKSPAKFGNGAMYLDGALASASTPNSPRFNFGTNDFTVEWWEYLLDETAGRSTLWLPGAGGGGDSFLLGNSNGTNKLIFMSSDGASNDIASGKSLGTITFTEWVHYAVCRQGENFYAFKNGVLTDSWTSSLALYTSAYPLYIGLYGGSYLASCIDEVRIANGEAYYTAEFTPPDKELTITPGTYFSMWTGLNASGTDITPYLVTTNDYGTEGATYNLRNTANVPGYISITTYGYGIYSDSAQEDTQEDAASIAAYDYQNDSLQQAYQQDTALGRIEGGYVVGFEKDPRTVINSITYWANRDENNAALFKALDVGDMIAISSPDVHNIAMYYAYIQGVDLRLAGGNIQVTYRVKQQYCSINGTKDFAVEMSDAVTLDALTFGYNPIVSGDNTKNRAFSAWINLYGVTNTRTQAIIAPLNENGGVALVMAPSSTEVILSFISRRFANQGRWIIPADQFALNTWTHVMVIYSQYDDDTDPLFFVNGVDYAGGITEVETPSGADNSEVGANLVIGNWSLAPSGTGNFDANFYGQIADVRIYDMQKSDYLHDEFNFATGLYTDGANSKTWMSGIIFQAPVVRTEDYEALTDQTLTSTDLVFEGLKGWRGLVNGSPILREPPPL